MMNEIKMGLAPVLDQATTEKHLSLTKKMLDSCLHFSMPFIRQKKWTVVPVPSASHFNEEYIKLLYEAFSTFDYSQGLAIAAEPLDNNLSYQIALTPEGLKAFDRECSFLNFVITNEDLDFAILCTTEDYYLVAGSVAFVRKAAGKDFRVVREEFLEYAQDSFWPELGTAERYQTCNG